VIRAGTSPCAMARVIGASIVAIQWVVHNP
jgi:hypothetical protein